MQYLPLAILVPLAGLAVEDIRRREVSVLWLTLLAVCAAGVSVMRNGWREALVMAGLNLLVVAWMGTGVVAWTWIRARRLVNPVNRYIGLGDIVFFLIITPLFPLRRFAWLLVGCMAFSLVWWLAGMVEARWSHKSLLRKSLASQTVPLVATSGIVTGAAVIFNVFFE